MGREKIATVELDESASAEDEKEIIRRLDDGNNAPGLEVEREGNALGVFRHTL